MNELNIRIIEIMVKLERTKSIFAKELGVSLPLIAHITSGRNKPGIEIIQKIILTYDNVNPDWLLNGKGSMFRVIPSKSDHSQIHSILNSIASELNECLLSNLINSTDSFG